MMIRSSVTERARVSGVPGAASTSSAMIPSPSWPSPSSLAEQSIPCESSPRIFRSSSVIPPGRVTPTRAKGYFFPAVTFGAPQTTCFLVPLPSSTVVIFRRSALGWGCTSSTRPITTASSSRWRGVIASAGAPSMARRWPISFASRRRRRKASSHRRESFIGGSEGELGEEAHVARVQEADVVDPVALERDALRPHPEGEAGVLLGIDVHVLEHLLVHHPAPHDLHPPRPLAGGASRPAAELALHVHLGRGFGEGEVGGAEAHLGARREEALGEMLERPLQVDEGDPLVDREPLDLEE